MARVKRKTTYILKLTEEEAQVLVDLYYYTVSGESHEGTRRTLLKSINLALLTAGLKTPEFSAQKDIEGVITFIKV